MQRPIWTCGACRSCFAASPDFGVADRRSIQWPVHHRRGQAAFFFALLQASLGIEQDPFANVIRFRNPKLPAFLGSVVLRGLKAGTGTVDLSVHRQRDAKVSFEIFEARGDIQVFER
jgi:hypothetical protein